MKRIVLIDGNNYVNRGFHAVAPMKNKEGHATHGIKGTMNIILSDLRHLKPDRMIVVFDKGGKPNWRTLAYPEYKRSPSRLKQKENANKDVFTQYKPIRQILKAMGVRLFGIAGVEADDLIGTLAVMFSEMGYEVLICSKDKDFASLVNKRVKMVQATSRKILGMKQIEEEFGVKPSQMVEYLMLQGDKIDNIPGITKCGGGTASKWLKKYGTIKELLKNIDDLTPSIKGHLKRDKKNFKWTRELVTIKTDIPHKVTWENSAFKEPDLKRLQKICKKYELTALHKEIKVALRNLNVEEENTWAKK